jgi:hypothetical protein
VTPEPAGLAGFWRFDAADLGGQWYPADATDSTEGTALEWRECDDKGGEWVAGAWPAVCGTERLGGHGGSLRLLANGYVEVPLAKDLAQAPLTLAAWVSVHRGKQRMTVAYVMREGCQSAWLDLQNVEWDRSLILSVEKPVAGSTECEVDEVHADLPEGFLDWGQGNWYHVAAVVDAARGHTLFVDGRATGTSTVPSSTTTQSATASALRIGAGPLSAGPINELGFSGLIDDVALFSRSVAEDELETFVAESTSVRADGQAWTPWSVSGSSATWKSDCRNPEIEENRQGAQVVVKNGYWSAGGLFTRTQTSHFIRKLKKATLVANIPNKAHFDFVLGSAHNAERCTWHATGTGKDRYEFDLDGVKHCDCPSTCDCKFKVEEARVGSRWDENGPLELSVCRVEFEWEEVEADAEDAEDAMVDLGLGPGGVRSTNGWCWRPISYHAGASVDIDESLTNAEQTVGRLAGSNDETAYLAADFALGDAETANQLCNLEQVQAIELTGNMPPGYRYQLRVADFNGIAREWSEQWDGNPKPFVLCDSPAGAEYLNSLENPDAVDCGKPDDPIPDLMRPVDLTRVRYIGVQKNYEEASDETISIEGLKFTGTPGANCTVSISSGGGPG